MAQNLSKTKSGIKGFTWMFFGTVFDRLSHIIIIGILARLLTPEEFGIVGIILIFVSFTDIFTQMGIGTALVQRKEINKNHISLTQIKKLFLARQACRNKMYVHAHLRNGPLDKQFLN